MEDASSCSMCLCRRVVSHAQRVRYAVLFPNLRRDTSLHTNEQTSSRTLDRVPSRLPHIPRCPNFSSAAYFRGRVQDTSRCSMCPCRRVVSHAQLVRCFMQREAVPWSPHGEAAAFSLFVFEAATNVISATFQMCSNI